jgi:Protein of unknown function (DUF3168)
MAQEAALSLQIAHIAALKGSTDIAASVGTRIFDYVPERTDYPFIVYHIPNNDDWGTTTDDGEEHRAYVHVFSDKEGAKETRIIMGKIDTLFHNVTSYTLTDHNLVNCRRVTKTVEREGQVYHGIAIYRAITEEN